MEGWVIYRFRAQNQSDFAPRRRQIPKESQRLERRAAVF
jgi:hypothetical protein